MGGHVSEEQRKYFVDSFEEIKNLGSTMFAKKDKKAFTKQKFAETGRKVQKVQAVLKGDPIPKKSSMLEVGKEKKSKGLELQGGKFTNGTLHLSKDDVKSVYSRKQR
eukprot:gene6414-7441_t